MVQGRGEWFRATRDMNRVHVYYSGKVQGIGFRLAAEDTARALGVKGWVKNLADSRVEIVAEADENVLEDFLSKLKSYFAGNIKDTNIKSQKATGEFNDFEIAL